MKGRIEIYLDIASLYSYVAILHLLENQELLQAHGVELEFHPVFLGGIMSAAGNRPPMFVPAKGVHLVLDTRRSLEKVGNPPLNLFKDLMANAKTTVPLRVLHFIKSHYPRDAFVKTLHYLFYRFWAPNKINLTVSEGVATALSEVPAGFSGTVQDNSTPMFSKQEVNAIMEGASSQEMKDRLTATTQEALDRGAYGAPWLWVTNSAGESEPFFGSDRFNFVYKFLGLPYVDVTLLPPNSGKSKL